MSEKESMSLETIDHYFNIDRFDRVVELAKEGMGEHLDNEQLWYVLGYSNYMLELYDEAEEQLIEAMRLGYDKDTILYLLGHIYMETERWDESEESFLEALKWAPDNGEIYAGYAFLMRKIGDKNKAKQYINKALELEPESAQVLRLYFFVEGMNNTREQLILDLEQYMQTDDSELVKLKMLALNAAARNELKEAREYARQAFLLDPGDKEIFKTLREIEIAAHPLLVPNRLVGCLGGPFRFFVGGVSMIFLLRYWDLHNQSKVWAICFGIFVLYAWLSEPLIRMLKNVKK
ncbi:MAG: tetratricopeptide repeat protein [Lysinibacillus sp.]